MKLLQSLILAIAPVGFALVLSGRMAAAPEPLLTSQDSNSVQSLGFYGNLEDALARQDWQVANNLTRRLIIGTIFPVMYEPVKIENLTCQTLQTIDGMWRQYSDGHFGFSVQGKLAPSFPKEGEFEGVNNTTWVNQWGDRLGWYKPTPVVERSPQWQVRESFPWHLSDEITYDTTAPAGHLPWIGEDARRIVTLSEADKPTCGSCSYDASHLQSERYYQYLPALLSHLKTCNLLEP